MPIRREALHWLVRWFPEVASRRLQAALFDRHVQIRNWAIRQLQQSGVDVFADHYLAALRGAQVFPLRCAIWAAGQLRQQALVGELRRLLAHAVPAIRRTALESLLLLDPIEARGNLIEHLNDASPSVRKRCAEILKRHELRLDLAELRLVRTKDSENRSFPALLILARGLPKWQHLLWLLEALCDPMLFPFGRSLPQELLRWDRQFNARGGQPAAAERAAIQRLLPMALSDVWANDYRLAERLWFTVSMLG